MHGKPNLWASLALMLHRLSLEVRGAEELPGDGRYLLVSNHRSPADAALTRRALKLPGLRYLRAEENVASPEGPLGAYPEGRVNTAEELLPFSPAPFELARREGLPIAIMSLRGSEGWKRWLKRPVRVKLKVLGVIPAEEYPELDAEGLAQISRERITYDLLREA
ncbi:MAG: lysophospholipid acyltransferase family protein [Faecousia sp.]